MEKMKKFIEILILVVIIIAVMPTISHATLQANGDSPAAATIPSWMWQIRNMQATGGTLGRTDSINNDLTATEATNLDIHMEKNTEYGAMILLSASQYGKPDKVNDGETTTGNSTGVVMNINKEWVAASVANFQGGSYWSSAVARYKNVYPGEGYQNGIVYSYNIWLSPTYQAKRGDAILSWHGSGASSWLSSGSPGTGYSKERFVGGLLRAYSGSIFSYYGEGRNQTGGGNYEYNAYHPRTWPTRAVIVVGEGI